MSIVSENVVLFQAALQDHRIRQIGLPGSGIAAAAGERPNAQVREVLLEPVAV